MELSGSSLRLAAQLVEQTVNPPDTSILPQDASVSLTPKNPILVDDSADDLATELRQKT